MVGRPGNKARWALNMLHNFIGYWRSLYAGNGVLSIMRGSLYILCMLFVYVYVSVLQIHRNKSMSVWPQHLETYIHYIDVQ